MLSNANILRIDAINGSTATGEPMIVAGGDLTSKRIRAFLDSVSSSQRYSFGATIKDADLTCFVVRSELVRAGTLGAPSIGDRFVVQLDGERPSDAFHAEVIKRSDRFAGGPITHYEIFMRRLPIGEAISS